MLTKDMQDMINKAVDDVIKVERQKLEDEIMTAKKNLKGQRKMMEGKLTKVNEEKRNAGREIHKLQKLVAEKNGFIKDAKRKISFLADEVIKHRKIVEKYERSIQQHCGTATWEKIRFYASK